MRDISNMFVMLLIHVTYSHPIALKVQCLFLQFKGCAPLRRWYWFSFKQPFLPMVDGPGTCNRMCRDEISPLGWFVTASQIGALSNLPQNNAILSNHIQNFGNRVNATSTGTDRITKSASDRLSIEAAASTTPKASVNASLLSIP
jgi:hypothetical protein